MKVIIQKVAAYITCENQLLVFTHVDYPQAGIQVPAGTVAEEESLDDAVLREAFEETGLPNLQIKSTLGTRIYDLPSVEGRDNVIHRHYYHLKLSAPIKIHRWQHWEKSPSEGALEPILFELFWVSLTEEIPELSGELGDLLNDLITDN